MNCGVKLFARNTNGNEDCQFRVSNDGLELLSLMITKRLVEVPISDVLILLKNSYPRTNQLSESTQEELSKLGLGCCIFSCQENSILAPVWNARTSCSFLLDKRECTAMLTRITGEIISRKKDCQAIRLGLDRDRKVEE